MMMINHTIGQVGPKSTKTSTYIPVGEPSDKRREKQVKLTVWARKLKKKSLFVFFGLFERKKTKAKENKYFYSNVINWTATGQEIY